MKYYVLGLYKSYLIGLYCPSTVDTYIARIDILFSNQDNFHLLENFSINKVLDKLSEIKYKNHFSQSKNAFLLFCKFNNIALSSNDLDKIKEFEEKTK